MLYSELVKVMRDFNTKHNIERKVCMKHRSDGELVQMVGRVVISNSVLNKEYPVEQRTYEFTNYNKALTPDDLGYSIFAYCKTDNDCMRIENYSDADVEYAELVSITE